MKKINLYIVIGDAKFDTDNLQELPFLGKQCELANMDVYLNYRIGCDSFYGLAHDRKMPENFAEIAEFLGKYGASQEFINAFLSGLPQTSAYVRVNKIKDAVNAAKMAELLGYYRTAIRFVVNGEQERISLINSLKDVFIGGVHFA